jgi:hypothetical protein
MALRRIGRRCRELGIRGSVLAQLGSMPYRASKRYPVQPSTPQGPDHVNVLLSLNSCGRCFNFKCPCSISGQRQRICMHPRMTTIGRDVPRAPPRSDHCHAPSHALYSRSLLVMRREGSSPKDRTEREHGLRRGSYWRDQTPF